MTDQTKPTSDISYSSELKRKFLHVLALIIPFCIHLLGKNVSLWILIPLSTLALTAEVVRVRIKSVATLIYTLVGPIMRNEEKPPLGSPIVINGATWVLISATILTVIFPIHIACATFSLFILGDAAAAIIGRKFGKTHWPLSKKTVEGSFAFFILSVLTLAFFKFLSWPAIILVSSIAMFLEIIPLPVNDNIRVPIITGFVIFGFEYAFGNPQPSLFF